MGSQNFHDAGKFDTKTTIPDNKPMDKMHGGHLFSLDVETEELGMKPLIFQMVFD